MLTRRMVEKQVARGFKDCTACFRRLAPSVFAPRARLGVSSRYCFVSTADVVQLFCNEGWRPVKAAKQRVRGPDRVG